MPDYTCFTIEADSPPDTLEIHLRGEIDLSCRDELRTLVRLYAQAPVDELIVDLREVTFLDSSGLAALVDLDRESRVRERVMSMRNVSPAAVRLIQLTGLQQILLDRDHEHGSARQP